MIEPDAQRSWPEIRDELNSSQPFLDVPGILDEFEWEIPEGMTVADYVAGVAAKSRLALATDRAKAAIEVIDGEAASMIGFVGLSADNIYERGQAQAKVAHGIMMTTGVPREIVEALPQFAQFHVATQINELEYNLRINGHID